MTVPRKPGDMDSLSHILFVVWGFPELSQTFIHREMEEMYSLVGPVNVLASHRLEHAELSDEMTQIVDRATYLGNPAKWMAKGLRWAARHPLRFGEAARWIGSMPHRTEVHRARALAMLVAAASVVEEVRTRKITYVHAHFAAYQTELAMCLSRLAGIPYGITAHATGIWKDRNILAEKIAGARIVLTCTECNANHLRSIAKEQANKVELLYHGLDFDTLPAPGEPPPGEVTRLLAVGRLVPKKGFDTLVEAVALLHQKQAQFHLTIVGDGPEAEGLKSRIAELGLEKFITMTGAVSNRVVLEEMARSHVLVQPSRRGRSGDLDGIPNVILEAMSMGRPVVGTAISGLPEVVKDGQTGRLVEPEDSIGLAEAILFLAQNRERARELGRAGREFVQSRFNVKENVRRQLEFLLEAGRTDNSRHE